MLRLWTTGSLRLGGQSLSMSCVLLSLSRIRDEIIYMLLCEHQPFITLVSTKENGEKRQD